MTVSGISSVRFNFFGFHYLSTLSQQLLRIILSHSGNLSSMHVSTSKSPTPTGIPLQSFRQPSFNTGKPLFKFLYSNCCTEQSRTTQGTMVQLQVLPARRPHSTPVISKTHGCRCRKPNREVALTPSIVKQYDTAEGVGKEIFGTLDSGGLGWSGPYGDGE